MGRSSGAEDHADFGVVRRGSAPTLIRRFAPLLPEGERVGAAKGRIRRIAIVALARKLLVALWRYVTQGVVPEGAVFKAASPDR